VALTWSGTEKLSGPPAPTPQPHPVMWIGTVCREHWLTTFVSLSLFLTEITQFIEQANKHRGDHTITFMAEVSETDSKFLDTTVYKMLDVCTHFKPTETFQYTYF